MPELKAIVVDDEDLAREGLLISLAEFPEIEVIGEAPNGIEAIKMIRSLQPDVVFLDIHMPQINGFEVVDLLGDEAPEIVFVTAFDQYAVQAFEANAVDYLLKPVNPKRLKQTITRLLELKFGREGVQQVVTEHLTERKNIERILVRDGNTVHVIPVDKVICIEAQDDYVAIKTEDSVYLKLDRISQLEQQLDTEKFVRIHRSYILNLAHLERIEDQKTAVLKNGQKLPVSRSGYNRFKT